MDIDEEPTSLTDPILALCQYWFSANVMHGLLHSIADDFFAASKEEQSPMYAELRTYYSIGLVVCMS